MMLVWKSLLFLWFPGYSLVSAICWNNSAYQTLEEFNPVLPRRNGEFNLKKILSGPLYQLGDFRGCLYELEAQYCMTYVHIKPANNSSHFWQRIQKSNSILTHFRRDKLYVGICVPIGCSSSEIKEALEESFSAVAYELGISVNITVNQHECQTKEKLPWKIGDYIVSFLILAILILVVYASIYDGVGRMKETKTPVTTTGTAGKFLMCFSVLKNWQRLGTLSNTEESKSLRCIQGIRVISIYLVILVHTVFWTIRGPIQNPDWIEKSYHDIFRASFTNGNCIMGTFLSISGFLLGYFFLKDVNAKGSFSISDFFKAIGRRYLRLTPVYAVAIALEATLLDHMGKGPHWNRLVTVGTEDCSNNWWLHLLYLQNYFSMGSTCMGHTWYLAVDFQCYITSMLVLVVVWKYPRFAKITLGAVMFLWILVPFVQTLVERLDPFVMNYPETVLTLEHDRTFQRIYVPFHGNASAYFVGVIFGYIYYNIKDITFKQKKFMYILVWTVTLVVPWPFFMLSYIFFQPSYKYEVLSASFYSCAYKTIFATGISVTVTGFALGYGWIGSSITSWKPFQIIGRLTYSIYIIHFSIQRLQAGLVKEPIYIELYDIFRNSLSDMVVSAGLALILCLCVEMPSSALPRLFKSPALSKRQTALSNNSSGCKDVLQMGEAGKYAPVNLLNENLRDSLTVERL